MSTPIEMILDGVEWRAVLIPEDATASELPYVTHEGVLKIGDEDLEVFQLSDGQRVISEESMAKFFGSLNTRAR